MESKEINKAASYNIVETIEYLPKSSIASKIILKKSTRYTTFMSFDFALELQEKLSYFHTFSQINQRNEDIIIDRKSYKVEEGRSIIMLGLCPIT